MKKNKQEFFEKLGLIEEEKGLFNCGAKYHLFEQVLKNDTTTSLLYNYYCFVVTCIHTTK